MYKCIAFATTIDESIVGISVHMYNQQVIVYVFG